MSAELLIFVGYGQDAKEEALAIRELLPPLQDALKNLNRVAAARSVYSTLDMFSWEEDAQIGVGGQSFAIAPALERAAIAIFVFKERVGSGTWHELSHCRNRPIEKRIPTFVLFPATPPAADRLSSREVAHLWTDLLDRRHELTQDWDQEQSKSITPLELYRDKHHLKEILSSRLADLLPSLLIKEQPFLDAEHSATAALSLNENPNDQYLDSLSLLSQYDSQLIQLYRSMLRDNRLAAPNLSDDEFLSRMGYQKGGRLTIAAALLFTKLPSRIIPSAVIRCTKYEGANKSSPRNRHNCDGPLLDQIVEARDFIEVNIDRRERPVGRSMQSEISYQYPMICVREVLANAVCHRSYEDHERLIYVTLFTDRIEIKSPGAWASATIPQGKAVRLSSLMGESVQRNMRLAQAISSVGMMEVEGSGIPSAIRDCLEVNAPEPTVEMRAGYVVVTIFPREDWESGLNDESALGEQANLATRASQDQLIELIPTHEQATGAATKAFPIVGLRNLIGLIERVAPTDASVLISGETGTGKELVARAIHNRSTRKDKPLVIVSCGALATGLVESELFGYVKGAFSGATQSRKGLFELAEGGTLVLDEVDALSPTAQVRLLRVLQERTFRPLGSKEELTADVRIITATNHNLTAMIEEGSFRRDLFFRLNVVPLTIPPLRERKEDIEPLVRHFLERVKETRDKTYTVREETMRLLENYEWPGNVRELQNAIEYAISFSSETELSPSDFPFLQTLSHQENSPAGAQDENLLDWNPS